MIIGISGKINSGKDEIGNIIRYLTSGAEIRGGEYAYWKPSLGHLTSDVAIIDDWKIVKFADKLKECVAIMIGCKREDLENREFKETPLGPEWQTEGSLEPLTPRKVLTQLGTELVRKNIHTNAWVNATMADYKEYTSNYNNLGDVFDDLKLLGRTDPHLIYPNWLITDVRFPNEAQSIKDRNGIIIRVTRAVDFKPEVGELVWINYVNDWYLGEYVGMSKHVPRLYDVMYQNHLLSSEEILPVNAEPLNLEGPENALNSYTDFDYNIYNDGTISDLIEKVREILIKEKILK